MDGGAGAITEGPLGPVWLGVVIAALITALVTVAGWLYSDWRRRAEAQAARREKVVDLQKALRAEVAAHLHQLARWIDRGGGQETVAAILVAGDDAARRFIPLLPAERHDRVFAALLAEIHLLDTKVVEPVVAYYQQLAMVADLADMIRTPSYGQISAERRATAYAHYVAMKTDSRALGDRALEALNAAIGEEGPALGQFSSLGEVP